MAHRRNLTLPTYTNDKNTISTASNDKRNMLWKAFRKAVLEPHGIRVLENTAMDKVPEMLLELVDEMCQDLDRHEQQAISFQEAIRHGGGFGPSPAFPPDIVPPATQLISRCIEPSFDRTTLPTHQMPLFELPIARPGLACGFSSNAFTNEEISMLPSWLTTVGQFHDYDTDQHSEQAVHIPFLMFERTYGHARREIEATMNFCAMDGAAALQSLQLLYDKVWTRDDPSRPSPVVFTCTIDDCLAIIHHHWVDDHFMAAPLCKFDLRDDEHFMHFLAWIESIEQWAIHFLLPHVKKAMGLNDSKALSSVNLEKLQKMTFDNTVPRRQGTPLAVTATMRMRSPPPEEIVIYESTVESAMIDVSTYTPHSTSSARTPRYPLPYSAGIEKVDARMPPPPRPNETRSRAVLSPGSTAQPTYSNHMRSHTWTDIDPSLPVSLATHAVPPQIPTPSSLSESVSESLPLRPKRMRSPATPDMIGKTPSPRGTGFRTKISNSLEVIKEHTRPKRARVDTTFSEDQSTSTSDRRLEDSSPGEAAWVEHVLQDRFMVDDVADEPRGQTPHNPLRSQAPVSRTGKLPEVDTNQAVQVVPSRNPTPVNSTRNRMPLESVSHPRDDTPFHAAEPPRYVASPPARSQTMDPPQRNGTPLYAAETLSRNVFKPPPRAPLAVLEKDAVPPPRNRTPVYTPAVPPSRAPSLRHQTRADLPRSQTPVHKVGNTMRVQQVLNQIPNGGTSNYLPLRDYCASEPMKAQTIITGPEMI